MREKTIQAGDILWLKLPQSLAPLDVAEGLPYKIRPFISLARLTLPVDHNNVALQDRPILGVDCTSQEHIVTGRPHVSFHLQNYPDKTTYALIDSIRDISSAEQKIKISEHMPADQYALLKKELSGVLRPEQRFYLKAIFNKEKKGILPGQIRRIKTINADGEALILFRRGKFVMNDCVEASEDIDQTKHKMRHTPYLVAYFPNHTNVQTARGLKLTDIQIMAVQERDIHEQTAIFNENTLGNIINQVRKRVELLPIQYQRPLFKHIFSASSMLMLPRMG